MLQDRLGRYHLSDEVGRGGMAVVYRATDPALERIVALKVLHPHLADRADSRERFTREARAVARLAHPHIVEVYDYATPESKQAYIVTEFIDGPTLRDFVELHPIRHGEIAALLMVPVLEALDHAHRAGIVHRDVKPENIMLRADGSPVLMDFGIAQMIDMTTLTKTGMMLGSPAHMAPEVVEGEDLTTLADVFSIGTVLYWLVCGALPFTGPNPAALFRRIMECRFDPVLQRRPSAGRRLARLIESCLAKDAADRPLTAGQIAADLRSMLADAGIHDVRQALTDFARDPEVYQDALGRKLVVVYSEAARTAYEARATARALDFLDRVLALDEDHAGARALVSKIEWDKRRGFFVRMAGAAAVLVTAIALILSRPVEPLPMSAPIPPRPAPVNVEPPMTVMPTVDAGTVATAVQPDAAPVVAVTPRYKPRPVRRVARPIRPADAMVAPAMAPMVQPVKAGAYKGATVEVDGRDFGNIVEIEKAGGVLLSAGRHTIKVRVAGCHPATRLVHVRPNIPPLAPFVFGCKPLPARFRIVAARDEDVFGHDGRFLGRTNRDIELEMKERVQVVSLFVGEKAGRTRSLDIKLTAGQRIVKKATF